MGISAAWYFIWGKKNYKGPEITPADMGFNVDSEETIAAAGSQEDVGLKKVGSGPQQTEKGETQPLDPTGAAIEKKAL